MKKALAGILIVCLILTMGALPVLAAEEGLGERSIDVQAQYEDGGYTPKVYSVDLSWGAMQFTYNKSGVNTWNPATHAYEMNTSNSWTASGNRVTVNNHSNAEVGARFSYASDAGFPGVTGSFDRTLVDLPSAVGTPVENPPSGAAALTLSGTLPEGTTLTRVGSITVKLETP